MMKRQNVGFTLIELLVVIAIIGILASLLMPSVIAVRQKAGEAQCISSLRDIGAMAAAITAEHNGWAIPSTYYKDGTDSDGNSIYRPSSSNSVGDPSFNPYADLKESRWNKMFIEAAPIGDWNEIAACPQASSYSATVGSPTDRILQMYILMYSQGIWSGVDGESYGGANGGKRFKGASLVRMDSPRNTILMMDAVAGGGLQTIDYAASDPTLYYTYGEEVVGPRRVAYRHQGKANFLFYDGHVQSYDPEELAQYPTFWQLEQKGPR